MGQDALDSERVLRLSLSTKELAALEQKIQAVQEVRTKSIGGHGVLIALGNHDHVYSQDLLDLVTEVLERRRQDAWVTEQIMKD